MNNKINEYPNPDNRKYVVRHTNPDTGEYKDKYFDRTKEICEFLDVSIHLYYKIIGGQLKMKSHSRKRWKNIKIKKLDYIPVKRKLIRKTVTEVDMANKFS